MRETQWKAMLRKQITECGGVPFSVHGHGMQAPGWPDLFFTHMRCGPWWIEMKMPSGKLTTAQRLVLRKLNACGSKAVTLRISSEGDTFMLETIDGVLIASCPPNAVSLIATLATVDSRWL